MQCSCAGTRGRGRTGPRATPPPSPRVPSWHVSPCSRPSSHSSEHHSSELAENILVATDGPFGIIPWFYNEKLKLLALLFFTLSIHDIQYLVKTRKKLISRFLHLQLLILRKWIKFKIQVSLLICHVIVSFSSSTLDSLGLIINNSTRKSVVGNLKPKHYHRIHN